MENTSVYEGKAIHHHGLKRSNSLPPELTREFCQNDEDVNTFYSRKLEATDQHQNLGGSFDSKIRNKNGTAWTDFEWGNEHFSESQYSFTDIESDFEKFNSQFEKKCKLQNDVKCETVLDRKYEAKYYQECESLESSDCESDNGEGLFENYDMFLVKEKESSLDLLKNIWIKQSKLVPGSKSGQSTANRPGPKVGQTKFGKQRNKTWQIAPDQSGSKTGQAAQDELRSQTEQAAYRQGMATWQTSSRRPRPMNGQNTSGKSEKGSQKSELEVMEPADNQTTASFNSNIFSQNLGENEFSSEEEISNDESGQLKNDLFRNNNSQSLEVSGQEMTMEITVTWENDTGNLDKVSVASETTEIISDQNTQHGKDVVVKKVKLPTDEDDNSNDVNLFKKKATTVLPPRPSVDTLLEKHSLIETKSDKNGLKDVSHNNNSSSQHQDDAALFDTKEASHHGISTDSKQNEPLSNTPFSVTYGTFGDNQYEDMSNHSNLYGISEGGSHTYNNKEKEQFSINGYDNFDGQGGQSLAFEGHHIDHHDNIMYKDDIENSSSSLSSSSHTTVQGPEHVCHHQHHQCVGHHHHHQHHHHHYHQYQDGYQNGHQGHSSQYHGHYSRKQNQMMQIAQLMETVAESAGLEIHDVMPDGNCMYRSIVDQLRIHGEIEITALSLRQMAVQYLRDNPCHEDGTHLQEFLSAENWEDYLERMNKDGEWGDHIMLRGIAEVTGRKICILSVTGETYNHITIGLSKAEADQSENIYLGHIDDAHYVSLRPKNWRDIWYANVKNMEHKNKKLKSEQSTNDQREVILVGKPTNKMLEPQNQGSEPLIFPSKDELIDKTSGLPYYHISFIIRHVLSENYFHVDNFDWEYKVNEDQSNIKSKVYAVGSAVENLEFTISSNTPVRSPFAFSRKSCQIQNKIKRPTLYLLYEGFIRVVFHGEKASQVGDVIAVTEEVHPGYLRLHPYFPNKDFNITWIRGHIPCLKNTGLLQKKNSNLSNMQAQMSNGKSEENNEKDVMPVYWSDTWPEMAMNWVTRERPSGWPRHEVIQQVLDDGCFIVPVHHPMSLHPECEWRFSFAYSEKTLAFTISKSQRHCFQVFKALVDYFAGDNKILSTYFLKTVFFHVCEAIKKLYWRLQPASCILYLFDKLLLCLKQKNLPHYFILENNIIDHFHDKDIHCLITRLQAVRNCPTIAVVLLAESHYLFSSTLSDPILKDIGQFLEHRNLYRTIIEIIVPTLFVKAQGYLNYMMFEAATETVKSAHAELTGSVQSQGEEQVVQLSSFAKEFINDLKMPQKFWFCFFLDYFYETHTTADLTRNQTGFRTLKEISGAEVHEGEFDNVRIPESIFKQFDQNFGQGLDDLYFMQDLCYKLYHAELYEEGAYYIRCLVKKLKQKIENPLSCPLEDSKETKTEITDERHQEQSEEYQKHKVISFYVNMLGFSLISLFHCYRNTHQVELFQEYISDLEDYCEREPSAGNYEKLSVVWSYLGNQEKSKEAIRKKELMQ